MYICGANGPGSLLFDDDGNKRSQKELLKSHIFMLFNFVRFPNELIIVNSCELSIWREEGDVGE